LGILTRRGRAETWNAHRLSEKKKKKEAKERYICRAGAYGTVAVGKTLGSALNKTMQETEETQVGGEVGRKGGKKEVPGVELCRM